MKDPFVRRARTDGYRSRAAFKLLEANSKERFLIPGARVIDLGAAPGGWCQVAASKLGHTGKIVAVDLLEIAPISGVVVIRGDFREPDVQAQLAGALGSEKADVVLSDMSPNISGIVSADQARAAELVRIAMDFCRAQMKSGGTFLVKVFQGEEFASLLSDMKRTFSAVKVLKPAASREESRETYLLARGLKNP